MAECILNCTKIFRSTSGWLWIDIIDKNSDPSNIKRAARQRNGGRDSQLDDGWPESVEEQGLLVEVWRHHIRNNILKMCYMQPRRGVLRQNSRSARQ
jgi:hypothetical protein